MVYEVSRNGFNQLRQEFTVIWLRVWGENTKLFIMVNIHRR